MVASLRHSSSTQKGSGLNDSAFVQTLAPWAEYAAPPWWDTMRPPEYSDSESGEEDGDVIDSESANIKDVMPEQAIAQDKSTSQSCHKNNSEELCQESSSDGSSSLNTFFIAKVQEQTLETVNLLLRVLREAGVNTATIEELLVCENFGRLVGLLRVNALSVLAGGKEDGGKLRPGMAMYPVSSSMNHSYKPNCYVASDPETPHRIMVQTSVAVGPGDELCIDYLFGAPYDEEEKEGILRAQYSIPSPAAHCGYAHEASV
jgi:hypothetical protein